MTRITLFFFCSISIEFIIVLKADSHNSTQEKNTSEQEIICKALIDA